jgi:hypothetical protein
VSFEGIIGLSSKVIGARPGAKVSRSYRDRHEPTRFRPVNDNRDRHFPGTIGAIARQAGHTLPAIAAFG